MLEQLTCWWNGHVLIEDVDRYPRYRCLRCRRRIGMPTVRDRLGMRVRVEGRLGGLFGLRGYAHLLLVRSYVHRMRRRLWHRCPDCGLPDTIAGIGVGRHRWPDGTRHMPF